MALRLTNPKRVERENQSIDYWLDQQKARQENKIRECKNIICANQVGIIRQDATLIVDTKEEAALLVEFATKLLALN